MAESWVFVGFLFMVGWLSISHFMKPGLKLRHVFQPIVTQEVNACVPTILLIQSYRTKLFDFYFSAMAATVSVEFYTTFLPLLFWSEHSKLARQLTILMALCIYTSSCIKDVVSSPRPPSPPVWRTTSESVHTAEYGLPSSHTINVIALSLYIVIHFHSVNSTLLPAILPLLGLLCCSVTFSRMYLGMHSLVDIKAGVVVGVLIPLIWSSVDSVVDRFILYDSRAPSVQFVLSVFLLLAYPTGEEPTPSFDDVTAFVGVVLGLVAGSHRMSVSGYFASALPFDLSSGESLLRLLIRAMVGLPLSIASKSLGKALSSAVIRAFAALTGLKLHSNKYIACLRGSRVGAEGADKNVKDQFDVDILIRFTSYAALCFAVAEVAPRTFVFLGI